MTQNSVCKKCSLSIDNKVELFTVCEGDCAGFFHAQCVGLSENEVIVLSSSIIWLCDECMDVFRRARDSKNSRKDAFSQTHFDSRNADGLGSHSPDNMMNSEANEKSIVNEVNELKDAVAKIMDTLAKIVPTVPTDTSDDPPLLHSTPVSSFMLQEGTNACSMTVNNSEGPSQQCVMDDKHFSLLLTNIDASVVECDIHRMVAQALGIDTLYPEYIDVVKLVSNWKTCNALDYVSFKVVLDNRWKQKAMNPSTWPKGVRFREFVKKRSNTWKPIV